MKALHRRALLVHPFGMAFLPLLPLVALLAAGCVTSDPVAPWNGPRPVREVARLLVKDGAAVLGQVVEMQIEGLEDSTFWQVRNPQGQWLGTIDRQGRVYQRVPFAMEERFLGIHPRAVGVALLCEHAGPVTLEATGGTAVPAEHRRGGR